MYAPTKIVMGKACHGRSLRAYCQSCTDPCCHRCKHSPVQRDGNGAKPRTQPGAQSAAPDRVGGSSDSPHLFPNCAVYTVNVNQRCRGEKGHVSCTEHSLNIVCCERSAEQDEENGENGRGEERG